MKGSSLRQNDGNVRVMTAVMVTQIARRWSRYYFDSSAIEAMIHGGQSGEKCAVGDER